MGIVLTSMAHDHLLVIANDASCFSIRAFDVPERSRTSQVCAALLDLLCDKSLWQCNHCHKLCMQERNSVSSSVYVHIFCLSSGYVHIKIV